MIGRMYVGIRAVELSSDFLDLLFLLSLLLDLHDLS